MGDIMKYTTKIFTCLIILLSFKGPATLLCKKQPIHKKTTTAKHDIPILDIDEGIKGSARDIIHFVLKQNKSILTLSKNEDFKIRLSRFLAKVSHAGAFAKQITTEEIGDVGQLALYLCAFSIEITRSDTFISTANQYTSQFKIFLETHKEIDETSFFSFNEHKEEKKDILKSCYNFLSRQISRHIKKNPLERKQVTDTLRWCAFFSRICLNPEIANLLNIDPTDIPKFEDLQKFQNKQKGDSEPIKELFYFFDKVHDISTPAKINTLFNTLFRVAVTGEVSREMRSLWGSTKESPKTLSKLVQKETLCQLMFKLHLFSLTYPQILPNIIANKNISKKDKDDYWQVFNKFSTWLVKIQNLIEEKVLDKRFIRKFYNQVLKGILVREILVPTTEYLPFNEYVEKPDLQNISKATYALIFLLIQKNINELVQHETIIEKTKYGALSALIAGGIATFTALMPAIPLIGVVIVSVVPTVNKMSDSVTWDNFFKLKKPTPESIEELKGDIMKFSSYYIKNMKPLIENLLIEPFHDAISNLLTREYHLSSLSEEDRIKKLSELATRSVHAPAKIIGEKKEEAEDADEEIKAQRSSGDSINISTIRKIENRIKKLEEKVQEINGKINILFQEVESPTL